MLRTSLPRLRPETFSGAPDKGPPTTSYHSTRIERGCGATKASGAVGGATNGSDLVGTAVGELAAAATVALYTGEDTVSLRVWKDWKQGDDVGEVVVVTFEEGGKEGEKCIREVRRVQGEGGDGVAYVAAPGEGGDEAEQWARNSGVPFILLYYADEGSLRILHDDHLFGPAFAAAIGATFDCYLSAWQQSNDITDVRSLPLSLPTTERSFLAPHLSILNPNPTSPPEYPATMLDAWTTTLKNDPTAIAFEWTRSFDEPSRSWTYAECDAAANKIALAIAEADPEGKHPIVPLFADQDDELMLVGFLGILKSGRGVCPLPTRGVPEERLAKMIERVGGEVVVGVGRLLDERQVIREKVGDKWVGLAEVCERDAEATDGKIGVREISPQDTAYVCFTSGSTGEPKAVAVPHSAILSCLHSHSDIIPLKPGDRFIHHASITFDVPLWEVLYTWYSGATLCVVTSDLAMQSLIEAAAHVRATHLEATPTLVKMTVDELLDRPDIQHNLEHVSFAGEPASNELFEKLHRAKIPHAHNMYGPTETIVQNTGVPDVHPGIDSSVVGKPFPGVSVRIVDKTGATVPLGVVGEVVCGGPQLATGYIGMPEVTKAAFYTGEDGHQRLYKTGDMGRIIEGGQLQIKGRTDDQIKIGGHRVEPGEISRVATDATGGRQAATLQYREPATGATRLVTLIAEERDGRVGVPPSIHENDEARSLAMTARKAMQETLPDIMISTPVVISHIPLTQWRKVDRRSLKGALGSFDLPRWMRRISETPSRTSAEAADTPLPRCHLPTFTRFKPPNEPREPHHIDLVSQPLPDDARSALLTRPSNTDASHLELAWAALLTSLTGERSVSFFSGTAPNTQELVGFDFDEQQQVQVRRTHSADFRSANTALRVTTDAAKLDDLPSEVVAVVVLSGNSVNLLFDTRWIPSDLGAELLHRSLEAASTRSELAAEWTPATRRPMLSIANHPPKVLTEDVSCLSLLHHFVEDGTIRHPDRVALDWIGEVESTDPEARFSLTYRELNDAANDLASKLLEILPTNLGASPHQRSPTSSLPSKIVPLWVDTSCPWVYAAQLAVLKSGHAFCPLPVGSAPLARIDYILDDTAAEVVIGTKQAKKEYSLWLKESGKASAKLQWLLIDEFEQPQQPVTFAPPSSLKPTDLAYTLYTSGSTGKPKCVMVEHCAAVNAFLAHREIVPSAGSSLRFCQHAALTFDIAVFETFFPWLVGGAVASLTPTLKVSRFEEAVAALQVTHLEMTPTFAGLLSRHKMSSLKCVMSIGERLTDKMVADYVADEEPLPFINFYGPTEAAMHASSLPSLQATHKSSNIGLPLPTTSLFTLALENDDVLPVGCVGELAIGGPQVARGYLGREDATNKAFVDTSFGRLYRTGDLARCLPDRTFEFLGRVDDQIKVHGIRVELQEISAAMREACGSLVSEVACLYLQHPAAHGPQIIAFVHISGKAGAAGNDLAILCDEKSTIRTRRLRELLGGVLPAVMVPLVVDLNGRIPTTSAGKVNRNRLRELYLGLNNADYRCLSADAAEDSEPTAQLTPHEEMVVEAIRLLNPTLDQPLRSSSNLTYSIGFDSLMAMRLASILRQRGLTINALAVLRDPTISSIARSASEATSPRKLCKHSRSDLLTASLAQSLSELLGRSVDDIEDIGPASSTQSGMLFESLKKVTPYFNRFVFEIPGSFDAQAAEEAWRSALNQRSIFRTAFVHASDLPNLASILASYREADFAQVVLAACRVQLEHQTVPFTDLYRILDRRLRLFAQEIVDLRFSRPPWHGEFLSDISNERSIFVLYAHHSLYDAATVSGLAAEASGRLQRGNQFARSIPPSSSFHDVIQRRWIDLFNGETVNSDCQQSTMLPDMAARREDDASLVDTIDLDISPLLADRPPNLQTLGITSRRTLVKAAIARVLIAWTDMPAVIFGEVLTLRTELEPHEASCAGPLVYTSGILATLSEGASWQDFVSSIEVAAAEQGRPATSRASYDIVFMCSDEFENDDSQEGFQRCLSLENPAVTEASLAIELSFGDGSARLAAVSTRARISKEASELFLRQVKSVLHQMTMHPRSKVSEPLSHYIPAQLAACIERVPSTLTPSSAHEWVSAQSRQRPKAIAVEWWSELGAASTLCSYRELDSQSNRVANYLQGLSFAVGTRIGVNMTRNIDYFFLLLGILKAGFCYVPIATELPANRKEFIVRDANVHLVFTDSADFPSSACHVINVSEGLQVTKILEAPASALSDVLSDDVAFICYTSGSTGTPKGCLLTHRGMACAIQDIFTFGEEVTSPDSDKYLALASLAFDVHLCEAFVAWRGGFRICAAPRDILLADLDAAIRQLHITHIGLVPTLMEAALPNTDLPLKVVNGGGEPMKQSLVDRWAHQLRLMNFYGPAEASIGVSGVRVLEGSIPADVGQPFPSCSAYVVGRDATTILARGEAGELVVEGPLVGVGYHKRQSNSFRKWPDESKWSYRTGDLVRMMPNGVIRMLGRIDSQIKINGVRIEPEQISAVLRKGVPDKADVVSTLCSHPEFAGGADRLVSFVALASDSHSEAKAQIRQLLPRLRRRLEAEVHAQLPVYMQPSLILGLTKVPLGPTLKCDLRRIRDLFRSAPAAVLFGTEEMTGPQTMSRTEASIAECFAEHARTSSSTVTTETTIFALGIHSLGAIKLAHSLSTKLGRQIAVALLFRYPSVGALAEAVERIDSRRRSPKESRGLASFAAQWESYVKEHFDPQQIEDVLPTFPAQPGILAAAVAHPRRYMNHLFLTPKEQISVTQLSHAWRTLQSRHPILRSIILENKDLIQVVFKSKDAELPWHVHEVDSASEALNIYEGVLGPSSAVEILENSPRRPLFRLAVFVDRSDPSKVVAHGVSISHVIYDGTSLDVLLDDLSKHLHSEDLSLPVSYVDVLSMLHQSATDEAKRYYQDLFEAFPARTALYTVPSPNRPDSISRTLALSFPRIETFCGRVSCSLQAVCETVWALSLAQHLGTHDVTFGVISSGRTLPLPGIDSLPAPLVNVAPSRYRFGNSASWTDISFMQQIIASRFDFSHVPLSTVQTWLERASIGVAFQHVISVNRRASKDSPYDAVWQCLSEIDWEADFPFAFELDCVSGSDELVARVIFLDNFIGRDSVVDFVNRFEENMKGLVDLRSPSDRIPFGITSPVLCGQLSQPSTISGPPASPLSDGVSESASLPRELVNLVARFLDCPPTDLSPARNLIHLGLTSISALGLTRRLREAGYSVTAPALLSSPSLSFILSTSHKHNKDDAATKAAKKAESTLQALDERCRRDPAYEALKLSQEDSLSFLPATPLQSGLLTQSLAAAGDLYSNEFAFRLDDKVSLDRLHGAWRAVADKHEMLRSTFRLDADKSAWVQVLHSHASLDIQISSSASAEPLQSHRFDQELLAFRAPPISVRLVTDGQSTHRMVVRAHHALYDANSLDFVFHDLIAAYRLGDVPARPSIRLALGYVAAAADEDLAFWLNELRWAPVPFALETSSDKVTSTSACVAEDKSTVLQFCKACAISVQVLGQATLAKVLARRSRRSNVIFGHILSGRTTDVLDMERVVAPLFNTVPCQVDVSSSSNADLLRRLQAANAKCAAHQFAPLDRIQKGLGRAGEPLFNALFQYQPLPPETSDQPDPPWAQEADHRAAMPEYELNLELREGKDSFDLLLVTKGLADTDAWTVDLANAFKQLLANADAAAVADLPPEEAPVPRTVAPESSNKHFGTPAPEETLSSQHHEMLRIVAEFLRKPVDSISPDLPAGLLGIDSIGALVIANKCRQAGIQLAARDILRANSLRRLSLSATSKSQTVDAPAPTYGAQQRELRPSPGQDFVMAMYQLSRGTRFFHAFALRLRCEIGANEVKVAWQRLTDRLPILRATASRSVEVGGSWEFKVLNGVEACFDNVPIRSNYSEDRVAELMKEQLSELPDFSSPPAKATLLHFDDRAVIIMTLHHILYDAVSLSLLFQAFGDSLAGREISSNRDVASFLTRLDRPDAGRARDFWNRSLESPRPPPLWPRSGSSEGGRTFLNRPTFIPGLSTLSDTATSLGVSLNAVLLLAWGCVQHLRTPDDSSDAALVNFYTAGRSALSDTEDLVAPCINVLPLLIRSPLRTLAEAGKELDEHLRERQEWEQSRLEDVHRWAGWGDEEPRTNIFVNILRKRAFETEKDDEALLEPVQIPHFVVKPRDHFVKPFGDLPIEKLLQDDVLLDIVIDETQDALGIAINCDTGVMDQQGIEEVADEWAAQVKQML